MAVVSCSLALAARYTVVYGHDCDQLNAVHGANIRSDEIAFDEMDCGTADALHRSSGHSDNDHDHDHCPVCQSHEQILQITNHTPGIEITQRLTQLALVDCATFSASSETKRQLQQPRAPPSV